MAKNLTFSNEARSSVLSGVEKLSKAVSATMGPMGKNVILEKFVGAPSITKDGVSVAREIELSNPIENLGCSLVKEVAGRTADIAGDGTTTATVLTHEIFKRGSDLIDSGYSPLMFRDAVNWTLKSLLNNLDKISREVETFDDLKNIASISANNDHFLGQKIAEAFDKAGKDGTVLAEASPGLETTVRMVDGVELKSGYTTPAFLESGATSISLENCRVLILDRDMTQINNCINLFNEISEKNIPILIIANSIEKEALSTFVANAKAGRLKIATINTPKLGLEQAAWLEDLSILMGTKVFGGSSGISLSSAEVEDLGFAKKVVVGKYSTTIAGGRKSAARLEEKLAIYEEDLSVLLGDAERRDLASRISFLKSKAAVLSVGYSTEAELRQKGDRIEDALAATRAAIEEGVVPGAGMALVRASNMVNTSKAKKGWEPAISVILSACLRPFKQILENAHLDPENILSQIKNLGINENGYDVANGRFCNLLEAGVIDPKKVTRTALENAISISLLLINTEVVVSQEPENPSGWQPPPTYREADPSKLNHKH